jgi:hypothetical protein
MPPRIVAQEQQKQAVNINNPYRIIFLILLLLTVSALKPVTSSYNKDVIHVKKLQKIFQFITFLQFFHLLSFINYQIHLKNATFFVVLEDSLDNPYRVFFSKSSHPKPA